MGTKKGSTNFKLHLMEKFLFFSLFLFFSSPSVGVAMANGGWVWPYLSRLALPTESKLCTFRHKNTLRIALRNFINIILGSRRLFFFVLFHFFLSLFHRIRSEILKIIFHAVRGRTGSEPTVYYIPLHSSAEPTSVYAVFHQRCFKNYWKGFGLRFFFSFVCRFFRSSFCAKGLLTSTRFRGRKQKKKKTPMNTPVHRSTSTERQKKG